MQNTYSYKKPLVVITMAVITAQLLAFSEVQAAALKGSIPQPSAKAIGDLPVGPTSKRVDLNYPTFSNPTNITNKLFPVKMPQVLLTGHIDGEPQQVTYSLLPGVKKIKWAGQTIDTVIIQYNAYLDRRIIESAYDWYAQDDDGHVWYLGEDVKNYIEGEVVNTDGTWIATKKRAAALIMPASPKVGDVFRVENIPGVAFEEVTVIETNATLDGAFGPITGVMIGEQLHMDGTYSDKAFAPNIGEYVTGTPSDLEVVALALPADGLTTPVPTQLKTLTKNALDIYTAAEKGDWVTSQAKLTEMFNSWNDFKSIGDTSKLLEPQMNRALIKLSGDAIAPAVLDKNVSGARLTALDTALSSLDMELRYRSLESVDKERMAVYARKAIVDAEASEAGFVMSDVIALEMIRERLAKSLDTTKNTSVESLIKQLRTATEDENFDEITLIAQKLVNFKY